MSLDSIDFSQVSYLTIEPDRAGQRLDNFLLFVLKKAPKSLVYRIVRKGEVRINKKRAKPDTRLCAGDVVRIPPVRLPESGEAPSVSSSFQRALDAAILFEDESLLVVNKPHGLAVHGGSGVSLGLIEALRATRPHAPFLELVHRLDRDTSGAILVAKKRSVLLALQRMLANKAGINKQYVALLHGHWPSEQTQVEVPLLRIERAGERMVIASDEGKASKTEFSLLASGAHYSLVLARPITGRTHQIRVHCQCLGHPIAGDPKYRAPTDEAIDAQADIHRLCLHAYRLVFRHPQTGEQVSITAPLEDKMARYLTRANCHWDG